MKVFISSTLEDGQLVAKLKKELSSYGMKVFTAQDGIAAGEQISTQIASAIQASDAVVVVISRRAEQNTGVSAEVSLALFEQSKGKVKTVIPVIIDKDAKIPILLKDVMAVDLSLPSSYQSSIAQLIAGLQSATTRPPLLYEDALHSLQDQREALVVEETVYRNARDRWDASIARSILAIFSLSLLVMLSSGVAMVAYSPATLARMKQIVTSAGVIATFASAVFAPLWAFVLGYYFAKTNGRRPEGGG